MRRCRKCDEDKAPEDFHRNARRKDGLQTWCKSCQRASTYAWRENNPGRTREIARRYYEKAGAAQQRMRLYGLDDQGFTALLEQQEHACAICRTVVTPLHVDHCHDSGRIRGLLCRECNVAIGKMRDDPARLRAAASYLES